MTDQLMGDHTAASPPAPGQLEREKPYFGPGTEADVPFAVLYQGEYETLGDGTAMAVRRHARALAATGIPVKLLSFSGTYVNAQGVRQPAHLGIPDAVEREVGALRHTSATTLTPQIKHAVVTSAEQLRNLLTPRGAIWVGGDMLQTVRLRRDICRRTILYTVWERDGIDAEMASEMSRCGELWVPCEQNRSMLIASGVHAHKIVVVPHPYDPDDALNKLLRRKPDPSWRLFYSIGRWEPRKAYAELIEAFLRAFTPDDQVLLTIKYSGGGHWENYPTPTEALERALALPEVASKWSAEQALQRVRLAGQHVSRDGILELHFYNNLYVSCSHGEAFNFGAFEAKQAGNRMVYTTFGGVRDYAASDDVDIPTLEVEPVPESYRWGGARWGAVRVPELMAALRRAEAPTEYRQPECLASYRSDRIGALMRERVLALLDREAVHEPAEFYRAHKEQP